MDRLNRVLLAFGLLLTFVPSGASAVTLDLVELFAVGDYLDGTFQAYEAEVLIEEAAGDPNPITAVTYTAPGAQTGSLINSGGIWENDVALGSYADATGTWVFDITDSLSNVISLSIGFTATEPVSLPDITSHANGDTLAANPTFTWTCVSCSGAGSLEAFLIDETTDTDIYETSFTVGAGSWAPGAVDPSKQHSLELELLNQTMTGGVTASGINGSFNYIQAGSQINSVYFNAAAPVPEPGTALLLGFGMAGLSFQGRRRSTLR